MPDMQITQVLKAHTPRFMVVPGVVGTGLGVCAEQPCLIVFVVRKTPDLLTHIPSFLEGYPVAIRETGTIRALDPGAAGGP